jgi:DNA-binding transcriptional LysR family regulator
VLTDAGRAVYRYAEETLSATDALRRELRDIAMGERDHIALVGPLAYVVYVLPSVVAQFERRHPDLLLSVLEAPPGEIVERVRAGRADIGVAFSSHIGPDLVETLLVGHLFDDEFVVIESADRRFSEGKPLSLRDLARLPFVRMSRGEAGSDATLNRVLGGAGLGPIRTAMNLTTWAGITHAVRAGVGVATVLRSVIERELTRGDIQVIEVEGWPAPVSVDLICSPSRDVDQRSGVFKALLEHLLLEVPAVARSGD